jgi:hypothetical protein
MTRPAGQAEPSDFPILHDAIAMATKIRDSRDQIEQQRRLPTAIVRAMRDTGVLGMAMPHNWGGPELNPLTQIRVIEALAMADGSVGWCAMINSDGGYITAFLDQDVGRAMYQDIQAPTAASATITGQATRGPWRLSCEWTLPLRQWLPALRVGLARMCGRRQWNAAGRSQRCTSDSPVHAEAVGLRDP